VRSEYEKRAHKELEEEGYIVDYKIRPGNFVPKGYKVDYFGLFDLIAYKKDEPIRWISIKGVSGQYGKMRLPIVDFKMPEGHQKEIWWINLKEGIKTWKKDIVA